MSEVLGIVQSDTLIRLALIEGMARMRENPALVDHVFAGMRGDPLLNPLKVADEIENAKQWFLKTEVPVFMSYRVDEVTFPAVTISLQESSEVEVTHGDVHYVPVEQVASDWPVLCGPFNPIKWLPSSGMMVLPASAIQNITLGAGMVLFDSAGRQYPILEVLDDDTIALQPGLSVDFNNSTIRTAQPRKIQHVESASYRETYQVGCHVDGEPWRLTYLHSIVKYILLKYKQDLLEARGFERSTLASTDFSRNSQFDAEIVFSRWINVTGYVRQSWDKGAYDAISSVDTKTIVEVETSDEDESDDEDLVEFLSDDTNPTWVADDE
jgi:hypothetical protein